MADVLPDKLDPSKERKKRFSRALPISGNTFIIPSRWEDLPSAPASSHEKTFIDILIKHGLPVKCPVPLVGRYSKSRRWSAEELAACVSAHDRGISVALMSAALNRNPQDIIFRLLDECSSREGGFREVGLENSRRLDEKALLVGRELFEEGLTAWRIAALFGTDFEGVEKLLYKGREDYGHAKKNPFAICTDHKQIVNKAILQRLPSADVLDAFAGEGRFARHVNELYPEARILCIEQDAGTFERAQSASWPSNITWINDDNVPVLDNLRKTGRRFDLIDLDPFVSCRDQVDLIWELLHPESRLFLTFGGEYRRSFIGTNRKAIYNRYGFLNEMLNNSDYLEIIPAYFLGWIAKQASLNGFIFDIEYCVRYPNNCRFWTKIKAADRAACARWYETAVDESELGYLWRNLTIPRFAEVRYRVDELMQGVPFVPTEPKKRRRTAPSKSQMEFNL
jgi:tRNA G26 N,N-dimethylase Trm1